MEKGLRNALVRANVREMLVALDEHDGHPTDHAIEHAAWVGANGDGTVSIGLVFSTATANYVSSPEEGMVDDDSPAFDFVDNPTVMELRIINYANGSIWFPNDETGDYEQHELTPEQQAIVDEYATAGAFWVTGTANGELMRHQERDADGEWLDPQDVGPSVVERKEERLRETLTELMGECLEIARMLDYGAQQSCPEDTSPRGDAYREIAGILRLVNTRVARVKHRPT